MNKTPPISYAKASIFPKAPTSRKRHATYHKILRSFEDAIASQPFEAVTLSELADRCGIARSTVYRLFASTFEILWARTQPLLDQMIMFAVRRDEKRFDECARQLQSAPALLTALISSRAQPEVLARLTTLAQAQIGKRLKSHDHPFQAHMAAGSLYSFLGFLSVNPNIPAAEIRHAGRLVYAAALLTDRSLKPQIRELENALSRTFPASVSLQESLTSPDYIVSMIDGRRYRSLLRHLRRFGFTPESYRSTFNLPCDYPMVAPAFSELRRKLVAKTVSKTEANG